MNHLFFIGAKGQKYSSGIYRLVFDDISNKLKIVNKNISGFSAEYLCTIGNHRKLLAIGNENPENNTCMLSLFDLEDGDGKLVMSNSEQLPFCGISHLFYSICRNTIFISIYGSGKVAIMKLDPFLHINDISYLCFSGSGPNRIRQEGSHPHSVYEDGQGILFIPDLGMDRVHLIRYHNSSVYHDCDIVCPEGSGPRHMCVKNEYAYIICELTSEMLVCKLSNNHCNIDKQICRVPLCCESNVSTNLSADIRLYGQQIAVSNRGESNVKLFQINDGMPELIRTCKTSGKTRNIRYDSKGNYLFCVNEEYDGSLGSLDIIDVKSGITVVSKKISGAHCIEYIGG